MLLVVWALATVNGVIPPVPSESLVIAVAVLSATGAGPAFGALVAAAAVGAFGGDLIAFTIGRRLPLRRLRIFRSRRGQAALDWADRALRTRATSFILGARFVPVGRVAVNMTAGATGFPLRRFVPIAATAAVMWAFYTAALGVGAGVFLGERPLLAMAVGIAVGLILGTTIDIVIRRLLVPVGERVRRSATARSANGGPAPEAPSQDGGTAPR